MRVWDRNNVVREKTTSVANNGRNNPAVPPPSAVAAIDIGTNSVLMLVVRLVDHRAVIVELDRASNTRLGEGVAQRRGFATEAVERTLIVLKEDADIAKRLGAKIAAVGTHVLRTVKDSRSFLGAARQILGVSVEVIDGQREAELTFRGGVLGLRLPTEEFTLVDVGGGSTEIVRGQGNKILEAKSLNVGAVRLLEQFNLSSPVDPRTLAQAEREVERVLAQSPVVPLKPLAAIGGTATTLAAIAGGVVPYDAARIHGARITISELSRLYGCLARMSLAERYHVPGLERARADIIVTGALILSVIAKRAKADEVIVSNGGVRFGLAQEMYGEIPIDYQSLYV